MVILACAVNTPVGAGGRLDGGVWAIVQTAASSERRMDVRKNILM